MLPGPRLTAMKRRTLLQLLLGLIAALPAKVRLFAQPASLNPVDETRLRALANVVLPSELGAEGRARVVGQFLAWLRDYRAGVDTDHGYGFPRLRRTAQSPIAKYSEQLAALESAAGDKTRAIEAAILTAKVERLPARPDGGHVATDLMAFYFNSVEATDLAYGAAIGRDTCRGLDGSQNRPAPLPGGGR
jgi:hypothetical protein